MSVLLSPDPAVSALGRGVRLGVLLGLAALATLTPRPEGCRAPTPPRVATFNIRNFPESDAQEVGAFDALRELGAPVVAVQEILDPARFAAAATQRLGASWRFVYPEKGTGGVLDQRVGVLFDSAALELTGTATYDDTVVYRGAKPAFAARLRPRSGGTPLLVMVVHFKAGADGVGLRRLQFDGLRLALARALREGGQGHRPVLLGDFNATSEQDRAGLAALAGATGTTWASRDLACTSYWEPKPGERCVGSALDHLLVGGPPRRVTAAGPCQTEGCGERQACPIFHRRVSDHCPVVADL